MKHLHLVVVFMIAFILSLCSVSHAVEITRQDYDAYSKESVRHTGRHLDKAIREGRMIERTHQALDNLITTAAGELASRGYWEESEKIRTEWDTTYSAMFLSRDIKDHPAAWAWVESVHSTIEKLIGVDLCRAFHFHDLYVLNHSLKTVFNPCSVTALEYNKCFAGKIDTEVEFGGVSVISYWLTYGICAGVTMGTGYFFVCGIVAGLEEYGFSKLLAPPLADFVWQRACINNQPIF